MKIRLSIHSVVPHFFFIVAVPPQPAGGQVRESKGDVLSFVGVSACRRISSLDISINRATHIGTPTNIQNCAT
jgi:hypothetical protein